MKQITKEAIAARAREVQDQWFGRMMLASPTMLDHYKEHERIEAPYTFLVQQMSRNLALLQLRCEQLEEHFRVPADPCDKPFCTLDYGHEGPCGPR